MTILPIENTLFKIVVSLGLLILTIFIIKTILSSCYFLPLRSDCKNNNGQMLQKVKILENENKILEDKLNNYKIELAKVNCKEEKEEKELKEVNLPEAPTIDTEKWEKGDISILDGCWILESKDYTITDTDTQKIYPIKKWSMCFNDAKSGSGKQDLIYENGRSCMNQNIKGIFDLKRNPVSLFLDDELDVKCSGNYIIFRRKLNCVLNQNAQFAECNNNSQYVDGKWIDTTSKVIFKKAN